MSDMSAENKYEAKRQELKRSFRKQVRQTMLIALICWAVIVLVAFLLKGTLGVFVSIVISFLSFVVIVVLTGQQVGAIKKRETAQMELLEQDEPFKRFSVD